MTIRRYAALLGLWLLLVGAAACGGGGTSAPAPAPPANAVPHIAFEKYTLPNGLDVILSEDKRLPLVSVNLWYHVGPANEEAGRTGFAHLFEHMMFQGSKHVPPDTHFKFLESAGASEVNGTTDFDRTNYFETLPSNRLELALWLESDRMGYLLDKLDVAELTNQQDVVRNERRQSVENEPYGMAEEAVVHAALSCRAPVPRERHGIAPGHSGGEARRCEEVLQAVLRAEQREPGDRRRFRQGANQGARRQSTSARSRSGEPVPPIKVTTPPITSERRIVVNERVKLPRVYMTWLTPAYFKPGDADADMTATILGGGKSSRLYKKLVYQKQIAQDVSGRSAVARARLDVSDSDHRPAWPHRGGARERRSTKSSTKFGRPRRTRRKSNARAIRSRPT